MPSLQKSKIPPKKGLQTKRKLNKKLMALIVVVIAAIGAYFLFFVGAATNGCTPLEGYEVCNVDQLQSKEDGVLIPTYSGELQALRAAGWANAWDYGTVFRAPNGPVRGAVPVHRISNGSASFHDFVMDAQKSQKEATYAGKTSYEGIAFYAFPDASQPGTIPVYKIQSIGSGTSTLFSTDKNWIDSVLAGSVNDPNGWRVDPFKYGTGPIAFYAYPNADCSKQPDFYQPQCDDARKALFDNIAKEKAEAEAKAALEAARLKAEQEERDRPKPPAPSKATPSKKPPVTTPKPAVTAPKTPAPAPKPAPAPINGNPGTRTPTNPAPRPQKPDGEYGWTSRNITIYIDGSRYSTRTFNGWTLKITCSIVENSTAWRYKYNSAGQLAAPGTNGNDRTSCKNIESGDTSKYERVGTRGEGDDAIKKIINKNRYVPTRNDINGGRR